MNSVNLQKWLGVLKVMNGPAWERAHLAYYTAFLSKVGDDVADKLLDRVITTMKFRPSVAELVELLQQNDGRPGPEEAWSMCPRGEEETVVWTEEMAYAMSAATPLLEEGDRIAARKAFMEKYAQLVKEARAQGRPVKWEVSLGMDRNARRPVLERAVAEGKIPIAAAQKYLASEDVELISANAKRDPALVPIPPDVLASMKRLVTKGPGTDYKRIGR